jgi:hypothetical protein
MANPVVLFSFPTDREDLTELFLQFGEDFVHVCLFSLASTFLLLPMMPLVPDSMTNI